jgi:hypothetical protein
MRSSNMALGRRKMEILWVVGTLVVLVVVHSDNIHTSEQTGQEHYTPWCQAKSKEERILFTF